MFIPARKVRGAVPACTRLPRLLSVATTGAVFLGAGLVVPPAYADAQPAHEQSVTVDVVGDSYMAGDGLSGTYADPADPRHRSATAPALQALARVRSDDPGLRVDANLVAAAGARTADFFAAQTGPGNSVVNPPQRDQVRPGAQLVIVGFGGDDARLATVLAEAKRTTGGPNTALDKEIRALGPLLDWTASDEEYLDQAKSSPPGQAPTLVARMLQVLAGIATRAPHAEIVVTTYPLAADPKNAHAVSLVGEDDLTSVRKFGYDLNKAIDRAVTLCGCGSLADLADAIAGHEIYTPDPAFTAQGDRQEPFRPDDKGASLIANPIADSIAKVLRIPPPRHSDGQVTTAENIHVRYGVSDRDGDTVADSQDFAPDDPARSAEVVRPGSDAGNRGSRSKRPDETRAPSSLRPVIQVADGLAPGVSPIGPPAQPPGEQHEVTAGSRPPAREQAVPVEHAARASEPAAAPPVPGTDAPPLSQAQIDAMRDVVSKAQPAGYVSRYSARALRASTAPADVRASLDMQAVDRQMSGSLLSALPDPDVKNGFRGRFGEDIGAIHNATTVAEQDAAIARFNETATQYNATELAARDAYDAHPVDALGDTVRATPTSLAEVTSETAAYGQVDVGTLTTVGDQRTAEPAQVQAGTTDYGSNLPTVATGVKVGPAAEVGVERGTEIGGVAVSGAAGAKALGGEANASAGASKDGVNAKIGASGYLGEATAEGSASYGPAEVGVKGKAGLGAEAGANATLGPEGVDVGAKGFAGAKAGVDGHADVAGLRVGGTAEGWYGLGAEGRARLGWGPDGSFTIGADAGVAVGIGGKVGFSLTVNPGKTQKAVPDTIDTPTPGEPAADTQQPTSPAGELEPSPPDPAAAQPNQAPPSESDAEHTGPALDPGRAPGEAPADDGSQHAGPAPATTGESGDGPAPAAGEVAAPADNDANSSGVAPGSTGEPGSAGPATGSPVNSDSATGSNASETPGDAGDASGTDSAGGLGDGGSEGGIGSGDAGGTSDSGTGDSGSVGGDTSASDSGSGDSSGGGSGTGDSGGVGGDSSSGDSGGGSGTSGSGGVGGDSSSGDSGSGDSSGGGSGAGDSGGGTGGGDSSGGMGGASGGGDSGGF
ncbi:hypothetical protein ACGFMK_20900 [Amycolatopsis sp. NPDC049252]|uniref:hypothetical protein n=1 Tax=Amycolatopsis sp. NPDC049252 TaxID=3363933 RepID=UPI0037221286